MSPIRQADSRPLLMNRLWSALGALGLLMITVVSLLPQPGEVVPIPNLDKALHFLAYTTASLYFNQVLLNKIPLKTVAGLFIFSALMEVLQGQTETRSAEWLDLAANLGGLIAGSVVSLRMGLSAMRYIDELIYTLWMKIKG